VPVPIVPTDVSEELTTVELSVVPVRVPAGAITALPVTEVTRPLALIVIVGMLVDDPVVPAEATVARVNVAEPGPEAVASPVRAVM
jgi:hypothetical protein